MNNTATRMIRSEEITIDMRICTILAGGKKPGEVYFAAIAPDMELTVITLDEAPDILPCFDAPKQPEDEWHPLFVEALQRESHIEYLLDVLLYGTTEEKKALVAEQRKEVMNLEQRFAEHPDEHDCGGSQRKSGLDR